MGTNPPISKRERLVVSFGATYRVVSSVSCASCKSAKRMLSQREDWSGWEDASYKTTGWLAE